VRETLLVRERPRTEAARAVRSEHQHRPSSLRGRTSTPLDDAEITRGVAPLETEYDVLTCHIAPLWEPSGLDIT
jgi:hypothetical protein